MVQKKYINLNGKKEISVKIIILLQNKKTLKKKKLMLDINFF